jgi:CO dehydrogenase/acetyl-CoA synthase beta subunit
MLEPYLKELRNYIARKGDIHGIIESSRSQKMPWPAGGRNSIVMKQDTGVEMGNPREESVSFVLWVDNVDLVRDGVITVIGPDIREKIGLSIPFGKIVIVGVHGFDTDNSYERYREMELLRYELDLKGYMMRAVLQNHREWSRVSREAIETGFALDVLGSALIEKFKNKNYIKSVEVIFTTSGKEDVQELRSILDGAIRIVSAMDKMAAGMVYLCNTCEYKDVCDEVGELRDIHNSLAVKKGKGNE